MSRALLLWFLTAPALAVEPSPGPATLGGAEDAPYGSAATPRPGERDAASDGPAVAATDDDAVATAGDAVAAADDEAPDAAPASGAATDDDESGPKVSPYAVFVGGGAFEIVDRRQDETDQRQNRAWTPALARIGLAGKLSDKVTLQSEVEFNAGPYGTSVWEGQAAIQVRNQFVRYQTQGLLGDTDRLRVEVGRVTDPASVNFVSLHIANLLLSDPLARFPLLTSGFNRGNGVRADYTIKDKLTFGLTANAGNPTSTTATVMMGGSFFPFQRFYEVPWSVVGRDARGFPQASFHTMVLSPSVRYETDVLQVRAAAQFLHVDVNMNSQQDQNMTGRNLRGSVRLSPVDAVAIFANGSAIVNDIVEEQDVTQLADGKFFGVTTGGGFDIYVKGLNGFGVQYDLVREEQRGLPPDWRHHVNAGATVFLSDSVFLAGRFALFQLCRENDDAPACDANGLRQGMLTMTAVLGPSPDVQP